MVELTLGRDHARGRRTRRRGASRARDLEGQHERQHDKATMENQRKESRLLVDARDVLREKSACGLLRKGATAVGKNN